MFAYDEAAARLDSALTGVERGGRPPLERADASRRLGDLLHTSGFDNYSRFIAAYTQALRLFEEAGDQVGAAQAHLRLGRVLSSAAAGNAVARPLAQVATWQVRTQDGLRLARQAFQLAEQSRY